MSLKFKAGQFRCGCILMLYTSPRHDCCQSAPSWLLSVRTVMTAGSPPRHDCWQSARSWLPAVSTIMTAVIRPVMTAGSQHHHDCCHPPRHHCWQSAPSWLLSRGVWHAFNYLVPIWNRLPKLLKNYTSKITFQKQIKSHLLAPQS